MTTCRDAVLNTRPARPAAGKHGSGSSTPLKPCS